MNTPDILGILLLVVYVFIFFLVFILFLVLPLRGLLKSGIFLIVFGLFLWLGNYGLLPYVNWSRDWPWIFIMFGLWLLIRPLLKVRKGKARENRVKNIIKELEEGKISAEEAEKRIKELK